MILETIKAGWKPVLGLLLLCGLAGLPPTASGEVASGPDDVTLEVVSVQDRAGNATPSEVAGTQRARRRYVRAVKIRPRIIRDNLDATRVGKRLPVRKYVLRLRCAPGMVNCGRVLRLSGPRFKRPARLRYAGKKGRMSVWRGSMPAAGITPAGWYGCTPDGPRWPALRYDFVVRLGAGRVRIRSSTVWSKFTKERANTSCGQLWLEDPNARVVIGKRPVGVTQGSARVKR